MKVRKHTGGVLFTSDPDIIPELVRFTEGKPRVLVKQPQAIVELIAAPSDVLTNPCAISSVLLKIVAIDKSAIFDGHILQATPIKEFQNEVHIHQDICERSVTRFGCSIAPTILYADVYTKEELMKVFPNIGQYVNGTVGLIFMERITHNPKLKNPTIYEYLKYTRDDSLLEKARRLFVMLAQLGFFHNDFHLKNVVITQPLHGSSPAILLIDFGRASVIPPEELDVFQQKVEAYDTTPSDALRQEILAFLYRIEYKGYNPNDYPESFGWFKGEIANEVSVTAPILLDDIKKKNCVLFKKIDYVVRELLKRNGHLLTDYPKESSNRVLVLYAVANFGEALEYASEALRGDKEVVMTAVLQSTMALQFASPAMRADKDVLRIALRDLRNPRPLQFAIDPDKQFIMPYIRKNGLALKYVDKAIQDTEMVMAAVSQNGMALEHAADIMKATEEMVMAAVSQNGMALEHAAAIMKATEEVVMAAVSQNGKALQYASAALRADEDVVLAAILQDGRAIHFTTLKTPKLLLYASLNGHTPTDEEIKLVLPFLDRYSSESEPHAKRQKVNVPFKERYKERIEEIERKQAKSIKASVERLSECHGPGCTISGGKNKKVLYGTTSTTSTRTKSRRTRTKSRRTRSYNRSA